MNNNIEPFVLKIKCHYPDMPVPCSAHIEDSGIDLTAITVIQKTKDIYFFDLGVSVEPPSGYYTELYPRSSIYKYDFMLANSVGIIDQTYRGSIMMPMRYLGNGDPLQAAEQLLNKRIAQLVLRRHIPVTIQVVDELSSTTRGTGGFGSTGEK